MLSVDWNFTQAIDFGCCLLFRIVREGPPGGPPEAFFSSMYAPIDARKPSNEVRLNAFRISKTRVSCLGTSWRRNELITLTLPKSGVARTVCYVNCFVQPTANTKTCLPTNNYGEHEKRLLICFRPRRIEESA